VEGNRNPNLPYIYDECNIGPRYGLFGPLFLEAGHIARPPPKMYLRKTTAFENRFFLETVV
jgi:hypothetical protein